MQHLRNPVIIVKISETAEGWDIYHDEIHSRQARLLTPIMITESRPISH